jgi:hypothetical protein
MLNVGGWKEARKKSPQHVVLGRRTVERRALPAADGRPLSRAGGRGDQRGPLEIAVSSGAAPRPSTSAAPRWLPSRPRSTAFRGGHLGDMDQEVRLILDVDIVVSPDADIHAVIERLESIGYRWRGDLRVEGRHAFKLIVEDGMPRHLVVIGRKAHLDHVPLRDLLREDHEARERYPALKRANATAAAGDRPLRRAQGFSGRRTAHTSTGRSWVPAGRILGDRTPGLVVAPSPSRQSGSDGRYEVRPLDGYSYSDRLGGTTPSAWPSRPNA